MDLKLRGRTCLITGASAGIGAGIAKVLANEGVKIAMTAHSPSPPVMANVGRRRCAILF